MLVSYFALLAVLATGCLAANTRVLNGKPATPHQFPYHVGLYWKWLDAPISRLEYLFGGALVSNKWVLTTAYYKYLSYGRTRLFVKAGKHVVDQEENGEQLRLVVRYLINPDYKRFNDTYPISQNDLALLQVDNPFDFHKYVSGALIPSVNAYFTYGTLAGWGSTDMESYVPKYPKELHYDDSLPVIRARDCANAINKVASRYGFLPVKISSNQTCSGSGRGIRGACIKDEGSAFVYKNGKQYTAIGIVAMTTLPCGVIDRPTVYTSFSAHSRWIYKVIESS